MPIICFEGASAVGKTTTAGNLKKQDDAFIVPEVNLLFERPQFASVEWYFERQVERFAIARKQSEFHQLVILDGDPFQPLWYAWAYDFNGWQSLDFMRRFYQPKIQNKEIAFPDLYFIFNAPKTELRERRDNDLTRQRRGFETHLKMIEPQRRYFQAMRDFSPNRVYFLKSETIEGNNKNVRNRVSCFLKHDESESEDLFDKMIQWLRKNKK